MKNIDSDYAAQTTLKDILFASGISGQEILQNLKAGENLPDTGILIISKTSNTGNSKIKLLDYNFPFKTSFNEYGVFETGSIYLKPTGLDNTCIAFFYEDPNFVDRDKPPFRRNTEHYFDCGWNGTDIFDLPNKGRIAILQNTDSDNFNSESRKSLRDLSCLDNSVYGPLEVGKNTNTKYLSTFSYFPKGEIVSAINCIKEISENILKLDETTSKEIAELTLMKYSSSKK